MSKYKVAYATGSRADYGIVRNYLRLVDRDPDIDFSILVTGAHLEEKYGMTVHAVEADGFHIDARIPLQIDNSCNAGILRSMAVAADGFGAFFQNNKYDLLIVLGDRYEMMAVALAAAMHTIPILHLHGGEITCGNYDEFIRHCITKMSTYHFTATAQYRQRVIQLGEAPERVFCLGALGAENCRQINKENVVQEVLQLSGKPYFVVAFHPETITGSDTACQLHELWQALTAFCEEYRMVFIGTNADTGSDVIRQIWQQFIREYSDCVYFENLNTDSFLYLTANSVAMVGNSSSGIIEAPSLGVYTVNIGHRQAGRVRADSVLDVFCSSEQIRMAMEQAADQKKAGCPIMNPYYQADTAQQYYKTTRQILDQEKPAWKTFFDLHQTQ